MTAITAKEQLLSTKNEQSHGVIPRHIEAKQIVGKMKKTARTEQNQVNMIFAVGLTRRPAQAHGRRCNP